jgi:DUF1365 family protein
MKAASSIYEGWVMHRRLTPRHHRFKYSVFALLLDLDELAALDRDLRLFKYNRFGVFSFHDRDHGPRKAEEPHDLRRWLDGLLADAGISAMGPRRVLCYPRIFGYVFNPLSVWFCHDEQNTLKAIVYEIHNTYEERHTYVLPVPQAPVPGADLQEHRPGNARPGDTAARQNGSSMSAGRATIKLVRHGCPKNFYVSPFLSRDCRYQFRIRPPGENIAVAIHEEEAGRPILNASFAGERRPLTDGTLLKMLFAYPLMTLKVIVAIHFEAVRLMLKGVRRHPHSTQAVYAAAE